MKMNSTDPPQLSNTNNCSFLYFLPNFQQLDSDKTDQTVEWWMKYNITVELYD